MSDNSKQLPTKKQKVIQPLNADDPDLIQAHDDMLKELQKRTAELAEKVKGLDQPTTKTLDLGEIDDEKRIEALSLDNRQSSNNKVIDTKVSENPAADLVRAKLAKLFDEEPSAKGEASEVEVMRPTQRSKHQQFMYELMTSGKKFAEIQTEWHTYYISLPDNEKHDVWREFYENQSEASAYAIAQRQATPSQAQQRSNARSKKSGKNPLTSPAHQHVQELDKKQLKHRIQDKVSAGGRLSTKDHIKSLAVGLGLTVFVGALLMFTFFNQAIIAPFMSPSRNVSATPILDTNPEAIGPEPKIIIPKINVEVPVVYDIGSIEEKAIQDGLENGVVHYATTPKPGQQGNGVIVGHSSNNILNSGKYKFAFVLLRKLEIDDTFYLNYEGVRYTYKIFEKKVVPPNDVSVLGPSSRDNTYTLITCDPPGTSTNRLIIVAEQVSPDPSGNEVADIDLDTIEGSTEEIVPGNAPSLWSRLWPF